MHCTIVRCINGPCTSSIQPSDTQHTNEIYVYFTMKYSWIQQNITRLLQSLMQNMYVFIISMEFFRRKSSRDIISRWQVDIFLYSINTKCYSHNAWKSMVLCKNLPVTGGSLHKGPVIYSFNLFVVISLHNMLNKQSHCRWLKTPWRSSNVVAIALINNFHSSNLEVGYVGWLIVHISI